MIASKDSHPTDLSQLDKFKQAARDLEPTTIPSASRSGWGSW